MRIEFNLRTLVLLIIVAVIITVVVLLILLGKRTADNGDNLNDVFGPDVKVTEFEQIPAQYNLTSLQDYRCYNPCVFTVDSSNLNHKVMEEFGNQPFYAFRMCNFALCPGKPNKWDGNARYKTKSFTFIETPNKELFIITHKKIGLSACEQGCQDARTFICKDKLYLVCNAASGENCRREMVIMELDLKEFLIKDHERRTIDDHDRRGHRDRRTFVREVRPLKVEKLRIDFDNHRDQKNWMPFVYDDQIHFVYSVNPHVILKYENGRCLKVVETTNDKLPNGLRGGSQIIRVTKWNLRFNPRIPLKRGSRFDGPVYTPEELYLGILHTREGTFQYSTYVYAFEIFYPFRVKYITQPFVFGQEGSRSKRIQFASGLARIIKDGIAYLYITYGENDCTAKLCSMKEEDVLRSLRRV